MKREQILEVIKSLANSQGSYGRLYNALMEAKQNDPDAYEELMVSWEAQNFSDDLDFIMFYEG